MAKRSKATEPVVVMEKAGRSFGARVVLADVNVAVRAGEVLGVIGPNGGGKSTMLMLMSGLLRATSGRVSVCGKDAYTLSRTAAGLVGLVTARPGLYPLLTGRENLQHFGGLFGLSPSDVDAKSAPLLERLSLSAGFDEPVGEWSTGMQQKLSLVRALLLSPKLLLLDEPTANLDPLASRALHAEVRKRADAGLACVLVTHELESAEAFCDRVLFVDGKIKREIKLGKRREPPAGPLLAAWREEVDV